MTTHTDGHSLREAMQVSLAWLAENESAINRMNVFPVPDGDTGTNMLNTLRSGVTALMQDSDAHFGRSLNRFAQAALQGARGNSGNILSMLLQGCAEQCLALETASVEDLRAALTHASAYAYAQVGKAMAPVEGTILTVARVAAERTQSDSSTTLAQFFTVCLQHARDALADTPNQLPRLKKANVVDSGGYGLVVILEGLVRYSTGKETHTDVNLEPVMAWEDGLEPDADGYGYDVQFLMLGEHLDVDQVRQDISALGWSPLVQGDSRAIKVHIHVHNPAEPLNYAIRAGVQLDDVVVENMQAQYVRYVHNRQQHQQQAQASALLDETAVVTVAAGAGLQEILRQYGAAHVIAGGQTMNPSVDDFAAAIRALPQRQIVLLPNNANIILTAHQVIALFPERSVRVLPTRSIPQGIAALIAYGNRPEGVSLDALQGILQSAVQQIKTLEITRASRDVAEDHIRQGEWLGLLNGTPAISNVDLLHVVLPLLHLAEAHTAELITLYTGADVSADDARAIQTVIASTFAAQTVELLAGGQPLCPYIISVE